MGLQRSFQEKEDENDMKTWVLSLMTAVMLLGSAQGSGAAETAKLVIQVSSDARRTHEIALNNAANVREHYGADQVTIEIVAYGPGLSLLTDKTELGTRISDLTKQGVIFSACNNTINKLAKKTGERPKLLEGVRIVPGGVVRIMELQQQGYAYVRP